METDLKNIKWDEFEIGKIFNVSGTITTHPSKLLKGGITPRITCAATNNGFDNLYKNKPTEKGGVITIDSATVGFVSFQPYSFIATDHVEKISLKNNTVINKYLGEFIVRVITSATFSKYGYGYKFSQNRIKKQKILLPVNSKGEPDYVFMEQFMRQKEQEKIDKFQNYIAKRIEQVKDFKTIKPLNQIEWGEFFLNQIFTEIQRGRRLKKDDHKRGRMPYISSSAMNNGIDGLVNNKERVRIFKNCLTIANSGSVGATFYQPFSFVASDHVTKLENDSFNEFIYLFISSITKRLSEKYSFNREINDARIQKEKILLPINKKRQPDYDYMENYIKKLEYEKLTKYLTIKKK